MARAPPLPTPSPVTQTGGWEGGVGGDGWGWGWGAASVPELNDSPGQPRPHMLSGEWEARRLAQTNRWEGSGGLER